MKKMLLTATAILTGLALAGCADDTVASSTAGKISKDELYEEMKETQGAATLQQMIINDVLTESYGETVDDKAVDTAFEEEAEAYGGAVLFRIDQPQLPEREYVLDEPAYVGGKWCLAGAKGQLGS